MTPLRIVRLSSREGGPPDTQVGKEKQDLRIKVQTLKKHESSHKIYFRGEAMLILPDVKELSVWWA